MTGLLCTGGEGPEKHFIQDIALHASRIIAADSGIEYARSLGIEPDLLVGDMDSLSDRNLLDEYPPEKVMVFPEAKDETDTEIGVRLLHEYGCDEIIIAGGGGGRLDHLIGILTLFHRPIHPSQWFTRHEHVVSIRNELVLHGLAGERVSFFPAGPGTATMTSSGLAWPLDGLAWKQGDLGISNIVTDDTLRVTILTGRLLMIRDLYRGSGR